MKLSLCTLVLLAPACSYDLSLGSQRGIGQDAEANASPSIVDAGLGLIVLPDGASYTRAETNGLLIDGADVVTGVQREIRRIHPDGTLDVIATVDDGCLEAHTRDDRYFYFVHTHEQIINTAGDTVTRSRILSADIATGAVDVLTNGWENMRAVAVDHEALYFDVDRPPASLEPYEPKGILVRLDKTTRNTRVLYEGLRTPMGLHVDSLFVYVADDAHHRVLAVPKSGGRAFELARDVNRPSAVTSTGEWVYFTERGDSLADGRISRARRPVTSATPAAVETLVTGLAHPSELVIDDRHVYWTSYFYGLERAPLDGGPWSRVVPVPDQGNGPIAMSAQHVYFSARAPDALGPLLLVVDTRQLP